MSNLETPQLLVQHIRYGTRKMKHGRGAYVRTDEQGTVCACVIGLAFADAHVKYNAAAILHVHRFGDAIQAWEMEQPVMLQQYVHPVTTTAWRLRDILVHLNDDLDWSLDQITDWLLTL